MCQGTGKVCKHSAVHYNYSVERARKGEQGLLWSIFSSSLSLQAFYGYIRRKPSYERKNQYWKWMTNSQLIVAELCLYSKTVISSTDLQWRLHSQEHLPEKGIWFWNLPLYITYIHVSVALKELIVCGRNFILIKLIRDRINCSSLHSNGDLVHMEFLAAFLSRKSLPCMWTWNLSQQKVMQPFSVA